MRRVLAALIVGAAVTAAAALAAPPHTIVADRNVGGLVVSTSSPVKARALFGAPSTAAITPTSCVQSWRPIGLVVNFLSFEGRACTKGVVVIATVTSRAAWRTGVGLQVGDATARLRSLYPRATLHAGGEPNERGWWLVTRRHCPDVGGGAFPGLLARMHAGKVAALVVTASICE
jgi:hypothetical protein